MNTRGCLTCRYYKYLPIFKTHLCKGPGAGEMTAEQLDAACETDGDVCSFYEYDKDLDDPCYGCPGSPDYCENCNGRE